LGGYVSKETWLPFFLLSLFFVTSGRDSFTDEGARFGDCILLTAICPFAADCEGSVKPFGVGRNRV